MASKKVEKKRSTDSKDKSWCNTFAKQNELYFKQVQSSKHCKTEEAKKNLNIKNQQKKCDNHTNANSFKKISSQKKSEDHSKTRCCCSVLVQDRAIQHPEMYDNDKFESNPIHILGSLMKELKDLVRKDKKACEISNKIEQVLSKISANPENLLSEDLKIKLKDSKAQIEDSSEKIKSIWELQMLKEDKLRSQIREQENYIKEVDEKQAMLEGQAKMLKEQWEEITRTAEDKNKVILRLKQQIEKNNELSERVISDLRADLVKQTELAEKNYINTQYLTLERDKYSELCCQKNTLIKDYQNIIKKLQNQIAKLEMNEVKVRSANTSTVHTVRACSSPTSSFSNRSTESWDLSNISSVRHETREHIAVDATVKDSAHLELVSLLDGESSHTILDSYQNQVTNNKGAAAQNNSGINTSGVIGRGSSFHSLKKDYNKENDVYKARKFSRSEEIQNNIKKKSFHDSKIVESIASNRIPVSVPSPVRDYPHPDWSDTSFSTVSNLDMVSSKND
ncbi:uncharacterized protein PF3D7_1120000-like isoform X2 [Linepithema humile]|uniref:uncharacterized protein PF3D7_1120000-like isoform X2 n=1 Tax=Linepithema humile TaxID=83485 RepID=UPI00062326FC|nr:PREDICTED: ninein-like isoform X2 [Linepithema humile]